MRKARERATESRGRQTEGRQHWPFVLLFWSLIRWLGWWLRPGAMCEPSQNMESLCWALSHRIPGSASLSRLKLNIITTIGRTVLISLKSSLRVGNSGTDLLSIWRLSPPVPTALVLGFSSDQWIASNVCIDIRVRFNAFSYITQFTLIFAANSVHLLRIRTDVWHTLWWMSRCGTGYMSTDCSSRAMASQNRCGACRVCADARHQTHSTGEQYSGVRSVN